MISVRPDAIRLDIEAGRQFRDYQAAVLQSEKDTDTIRETLRGAGLDPKELKTTHFEINAEYRYDSRKRRLFNYHYHHGLYIQFSNDNEILGKVLFGLARCPVKVEFSIIHTVKDVDDAKNRLIGKAAADSRVKAEVLAQAAGVQLGNVVKIDYSWGEMDAFSQPFQPMENVSNLYLGGLQDGQYHMNIEADDIKLQDTVTVVWEIVQGA